MEPKLEVTNLITPLINTFKTLNSEWKHLFDIGVSDYLHSQTEKYYFTNTFMHRGEKVRFDDIYYPIKASYKNLTTDFDSLNEIFENYKNITIIGSAGSGKTTLIKHIFLNCIRSTKKIPILIELRFLNDYNGDFEKLISEKILMSKLKPSQGTFKRALEDGIFLFLLDGYDEIFSKKKQIINQQIELFIDSYPKNNFMITTRPGSGIESFSRFSDFKVNNLEDDDVKGFINKLIESTERISRILKIIKDPNNANYIEYLRNPLLLSMFIIAFESHPEIPSRKSSFYRNVFDTLYSKHDGITKNSFPREKKTKFEREEFEKILGIFSYLSTLDGRYSFTNEYLTDTFIKVLQSTSLKCSTEDLIYDLQTTISILILDGFEYYFPHRSMQEYFTGQFISTLPSDKKEFAYNNIIESLIMSSNDSSFNLWSIFYELDSSAFKTYFLIPQLKRDEKILQTNNDEELLNKYIEMVNPDVVYSSFGNNNHKELLLFRDHTLHSSLVKFCEIYDYHDFFFYTENVHIKDFIIKTLGMDNKNGEIMVQLQSRPEVIKILLNAGAAEIIKKYKVLISKKIKTLEAEVKRDQNKLNNLLNI